jgi:hypothetical protein
VNPVGLNGRHHSPEERNKVTGRFVKGHKLVGNGRPLGSRNRLATAFLSDLQRQWMKSGKKALERTAEDDPVAFTKIVAGLLPREMLASVISVNTNVDVSLFADAQNFAEAFRLARQHIGADQPPMIEAAAEPEQDEPDEFA